MNQSDLWKSIYSLKTKLIHDRNNIDSFKKCQGIQNNCNYANLEFKTYRKSFTPQKTLQDKRRILRQKREEEQIWKNKLEMTVKQYEDCILRMKEQYEERLKEKDQYIKLLQQQAWQKEKVIENAIVGQESVLKTIKSFKSTGFFT